MVSFQRVAVVIVTLTIISPTVAWSQVSGVDEMIVTTRQKEERLQDVPIAVSALSAAEMQRQGVAGIDDIVKLSPSVQFDRSFGPADTRVTIRGLSNTRGRSNVAFLIDGVDVTTENLNAAGSGLLVNQRLLSDIQRVEIVKGPQSALYGRAAFAGAINYITKEPDDIWEGNVNWDLGDYGEKQFDLALGGPVTETLGVRLSSVYWEGDGFYDNTVSGEPVGDTEGYALALTTLYTPNDFSQFKFRVEYSDEELGPLPNVRIGGGTSGVNLALVEYPTNALEVGLGTNRNRFVGENSTSTALDIFGQYCPPELQDPSRGPGFCLPTNFGKANDLRVEHSPDPATGTDFIGSTIENLRVSLRATFDVEGIGRFTSITGFTDADSLNTYDQDWQAPEADLSLPIYSQVSGQGQLADVNTKQFSQEIRFQTQLDGPLQFTAGALFWDEKRDFRDKTFIIFCAPGAYLDTDGDSIQDSIVYGSGYCDGGPTASGNGFTTVDNWRQYWEQLQPRESIQWVADTRHWSFYGLIDWEISEQWSLSFENRFVSERFTFQKPAFSSCTTFVGPNPANASLEVEEADPVTGEILNPATCTADVVLDPDIAISDFFGPALGTPVGWRYQIGSQNSHFNTPRVILTWRPMDELTIYGSWANAQKPGGIASTPGGGSPVSINDDRFEPEKMDAYELGIKSQWDTPAGFLQVNAAGFLQDYTDKQIGTQRLVDGVLQPIIVNAAAAEIWGLEIETVWAPSFFEGLTLNFAYTYLDAEYVDFVDNTTSVQRAAVSGGCNVIFLGDPNDPAAQAPNGNIDPNISLPRCALDFSGNQLERTPEHALVTGGSYTAAFFDQGFDWFVELTAAYQDERFLEADNGVYFDDYWLIDTRFGLQGDNWDVLLYVDNLFDDDTIKSGGSGPDFAKQVSELGFTAGLGVTHFFGTLPNPRVFGLRASYRFEF